MIQNLERIKIITKLNSTLGHHSRIYIFNQYDLYNLPNTNH